MGCKSQNFFHVGSPPGFTAVHHFPESLVCGNYHDTWVFVALLVTNTNQKVSVCI